MGKRTKAGLLIKYSTVVFLLFYLGQVLLYPIKFAVQKTLAFLKTGVGRNNTPHAF